MTIQSRVSLKNVFEDGDTISESNLADWLDSFLHLTDSSAQSITSHVVLGGGAGVADLSANNISIASALTVSGNASLHGTASLSTVSANSINTDSLKVSGATSAGSFFAASMVVTSSRTAFLTASAAALHSLALNVATTAAASGGGVAIPIGSAAGFVELTINGEARRFVYYNP